MTESKRENSFVTDGRIVMARNHASELAAKEPWATPHACAEKAVRTVFGKWLLDPTAAVRSEYIPLYFRLVNRVESQLGVHRRPNHRSIPSCPAVMQPHAPFVGDFNAAGTAAAIAV